MSHKIVSIKKKNDHLLRVASPYLVHHLLHLLNDGEHVAGVLFQVPLIQLVELLRLFQGALQLLPSLLLILRLLAQLHLHCRISTNT